LNFKPARLRPVAEVLRAQGRFKHLTDEEVAAIQRRIEENWERLLSMDGRTIF